MALFKEKHIAVVLACILAAAGMLFLVISFNSSHVSAEAAPSDATTSGEKKPQLSFDTEILDRLLSSVPPTHTKKRAGVHRGSKFPPESRAWGETYKTLKPLMDGGNAAAAERLYRDTSLCIEYPMLPAAIAGATAGWNQPGISSSEAEKYISDLDRLEGYAKTLPGVCGATDPARLRRVVPDILQKAALLDVKGAATCYVSGSRFPYRASPDGQSLVPQYNQVATQLVQAALTSGDWSMLHLLTHASDPSSLYQSSWVPSLVGNDPRVVYGLNRLELEGASGNEVKEIQATLREIVQQRRLTQEQVESLDAWAKQMYSRYFRNQPTADFPEVPPCEIDESNS